MYFEALVCGIAEKDPLKNNEVFPKACQRKRERGEQPFAPRRLPFSYERWPAMIQLAKLHSSRQNLTAFSTATGKNLAAVGSSHSLPETVNLGTMTAAGLVGTLHNTYTSYIFFFICSTVR